MKNSIKQIHNLEIKICPLKSKTTGKTVAKNFQPRGKGHALFQKSGKNPTKWNQKHRPQGKKEQRKALSIWRDQRINNHAHASTQASTREHSTLNIHAGNPEPRNEEIETENERENARHTSTYLF